MRFFISGPRFFGGLIRPGISFGGPRFGRSQPGASRAAVDYIYVIEGTHGLVKIGKSNDPDVRRATLQTGSAHLLRIASVTPIPIIWVEAVERKAHDILDAYRGNGEWFAVTPNVAVATIYAAAERIGVDLTAKISAVEPEREPMARGITAAMLLVILGGLFGGAPAAITGLGIMAAIVIRRLVRRPLVLSSGRELSQRCIPAD